MGLAAQIKRIFSSDRNDGQLLSLQEKASRTGPITVQFTEGQPQFTPRRYDRLADEGYVKNVVAHRCIKLIAQNASSIKWHVYQGNDQNRRQVLDHPLCALLKRPNPMQSLPEFIETLCGFMLISGNGYVEGVGPESAPNELWILRPDRIQIIPGENGIPEAYRYAVNGQHIDFGVDILTGASHILHLKSFHPLNDWYGMSAMEAAAYSIDQHNAAAKWNTGLLQNSGRPSGALVYTGHNNESDGNLTDVQRDSLREELERYYQGGAHAGRPLVLEGGLDWREMSLSPKDLDWIKGKDVAAREIALAFHIPPQLVGVEGSLTYANFEQARLAFYDDAVLPLVNHIRDELNNWLAPQFGSDIKIDYDTDSIEALAPRRHDVWRRISEADFLTRDEKRAALGFDPIGE